MLTLEDYLVLYTDGVTEARRDGETVRRAAPAGDRRRACAAARAQEVAEDVRDAAVAFAGGSLRDDLQVVVLRLA